ncbi:MAG: hypothetical protein ACI9T8_000200 [Candidatus Saccharimonadales bacterium]|jgi:hypothetical protein
MTTPYIPTPEITTHETAYPDGRNFALAGMPGVGVTNVNERRGIDSLPFQHPPRFDGDAYPAGRPSQV